MTSTAVPTIRLIPPWIGADSSAALKSPTRGRTPTSFFQSQITRWIKELSEARTELTSTHLIEKSAVAEQLKSTVEELGLYCHEELTKNPVSFVDNFHETHFFVPKTLYAQIEAYHGLDTSRATYIDPTVDEHTEAELDELHALERSLGSRPCEFELDIYELNDALTSEGVSSEAEFVSHFKEKIGRRRELVQVALLRSELLYQQIYEDYERKRDVISSQIPSAREGLIILFGCEHTEIKNHVLDRLIDVLNADPLTPESYYNLPRDVELLLKLLDLKSSQNLAEGILSKLIEVFALSVNNIWLYSNREDTKTGAIIEDELRHHIWEAADALRKLNTKGSPTVNFWIDFAVQAVQGVQTEVTKREEFIGRLKHVSLAIFSIVTIIGKSVAKEEADVSPGDVEAIIGHFSKAFYHIRSKEDWFEPLLAFKYMCHLTRYCPSATTSLVEMVLYYKCEETDQNLFLGMVSHLESLILHTTHAETTEACLKVLMTLIFFDNELIQKRIVQALWRMKNTGKPTLSVVCDCLLHLVYHSHNKLRDAFPSLATEIPLPKRFSALAPLSQTLCTHVMALFIRFTVDIQTESGLSSESILCQLTRSTTGDLDGDGTARVVDMMNALKAILPNPLTPDADGNTFLHLCVRRGNTSLIPIVFEIFTGQIMVNAINQEGRSPLMLCLEPKAPPFLEGISILAGQGASPNIRDRFGKTFVHYLVDAVISNVITAEDMNYIFSKIAFSEPIDIDSRNAEGYTPLMLSLRHNTAKSSKVAEILLKNGADIHLPNPLTITPLETIIELDDLKLLRSIPTSKLDGERSDKEYTCFMIAAHLGRGEILNYLFKELPNHLFSRTEALFVMKSAFTSFIKAGESDTVLPVIQKYMKDPLIHPPFLLACQQALPGFNWDLKEESLAFTFRDEPISTSEIAAAIRGQACSEQAATVFGISSAMRMCFQANRTHLEDIAQELRRDPSQLRTTNILGRNILQVALLEGDPEVKDLILSYERQSFNNQDHRGNQPLHYAAATLDRKAYQRILSKVGETNALPLNHMNLPPIVMALRLPERMFPEPTSEFNPYPEEYTSEMHANFCGILDDTIKWYREKHLLIHDKDAAINPLNYRNREPFTWNILHYAAVYGMPQQAKEVSKKLPELFFDLHRKRGRTPIEQSLFRNRIDLAKALLEGWVEQQREGGDPTPLATLYEYLSRQGLSLWAILAEVGDVNFIKELVDNGLPLNTEEESYASRFRFSIGTDLRQYHMGVNPFAVCVQTAIRLNDIDLLRYLADNFPEALLKLQDEAHNTPLMLATRLRRIQCMQLFIELASLHGALESYIRKCNISGQAVIHILCCTPRTIGLEQIISNTDCSLIEAQTILDSELVDSLRVLLDAGANLSHKDDGGNTALHLICGHNHAALLQYIYRRVSFLHFKEISRLFNALNDDKRSPIFAAVANASMDVFRALVEIKNSLIPTEFNDILFDLRDINGLALLHLSAQEGQEGQKEICETLITLGADILAIDEKGETAIHKAAFNRRIMTLEYLLRLAAASPVRARLMAPDYSQMTALHKAILLPPDQYRRSLRRYCEQRLITASGLHSPHRNVTKASITPSPALTMLTAPRHGLSVSIDIMSEGSLTAQALAPYECAGLTGSRLGTPDLFDSRQIALINEVVVKLLDFGFSMEAPDQQGLSPWHYLMRGPYKPVLEHALGYFTIRGANPPFTTLRSHAGETVAHIAAKFGQTEQLAIVASKMSAKKQASLNLKTTEGLTAVALALLGDHVDCVDILVALGCRLDRSTRPEVHASGTPKNKNMLHMIVQKTQLDARLIKLFWDISAKHPHLLEGTTIEGRTPLEELAINGHHSLLPLTVTRMKRTDNSRAAIARARGLVQAKLTTLKPSAEATTKARIAASRMEEALTRIRLILNFGNIQDELGKAFGSFSRVNRNFIPISLEALESRATSIQSPTRASATTTPLRD